MKKYLRQLPNKKTIYIISTAILMLFATIFATTLLAPSAEAIACACNDHCNGNAPDNQCSVHKGCNSNKTGICQQCPNAGSPQGCPAGQICRNNANGKNICVLQNNPVTPPPPTSDSVHVCPIVPADIMLVIDNSNSMTSSDKLPAVKAATSQFVDIIAKNGKMRVGVATFDDNGNLNQGLSSNYAAVKNSINSVVTGGKGGTCLECAIDTPKRDTDVRGAFAQPGNNGNARHVIILTDGDINRWVQPDGTVSGSGDAADEAKARDQARNAIAAVSNDFGAVFWVVHYGASHHADYLQGIVRDYIGNKGAYYLSTTTSVEQIYRAIAQEIIGGSVTAHTYDDVNKNGQADAGEPPIANVTTQLTLGTTVVGSKNTGADGNALYDKLCPGNYTISVTKPDTYTVTPGGSLIKQVTLTAGGAITEKFGFFKDAITAPVSFLFNLALHGIGIAGDNVLLRPTQCKTGQSATGSANPCLSNQKPLHPDRDFSVEVINSLNKVVATMSGTLKYTTTSGLFTAHTATSSGLSKGVYTFRVMTPMYLKKKIIFPQTIESGKEYTLPTTDLTSSDVDSDNVLTILDYNQIISCYQFPNRTNPCAEEKVKAVDNDDNGIIDEYNINLFVRDVSAIQGD